MIHSTVAMEDGHTLLFSPFTVTPVHTVIWPVVPLAGKDVETLWGGGWNNTQKENTSLLQYVLQQTLNTMPGPSEDSNS